MRSVCVAFFLLCAITAATAAMIEVRHPEAGSPLVLIKGDFEFGDIDTFSATVAPLSKATISFASEGGALLAGIRIGTLIRQKRFATLVPEGALCASACAVAWLGGAKRFVGRAASVGFHAAYVVRAGAPTESGPGNAVLGAYLNQLGLSEEAIRYVTEAGPSTMHWMSMAEAADHGIAVAQWDAAEPAGRRAGNLDVIATGADYPQTSSERRAVDFVQSLPARWSDPHDAVALGSLYTDVVLYHGKPLARDRVVAQKVRLAERWAKRKYTMRPASLAAICTRAGGVCQVKGIMDWELRNARSGNDTRGVASFDVSLLVEGDTPQIAAESGSETEKPRSKPSSLTQAGQSFRALVAKLSKLNPLSRARAGLRPETPVPR